VRTNCYAALVHSHTLRMLPQGDGDTCRHHQTHHDALLLLHSMPAVLPHAPERVA
jgi:hypothetical protein